MTNAPSATAEPGQMTHREILEALTGLLLAMFVAMLSSTVVSNALPAIVTDLHGSQTGYTWVVVATLLTMTATTPIWGKLADLFSKKLLVQVALVIFSAGSVVAAVAPSMGVLIGARAFQGLGVGGLTALVQVVIASMVSPRERGRYSGYIGAVFATATVSGPLLGGLIVDSPMGWRGCFIVGIPIAAIAFVVLQKTLHLPTIKRDVKIDYLGATLIMAGISLILVWVSLAGTNFDWISGMSAGLVVGSLALIGGALWVEAKVASEPVIPLRLFRDRTTALATAASVMIGVAMFGATVYLSQYFQLARGMSPTEAGLMSVCMVGGLLVSSIVSGRIITQTGLWKRWLVGGMIFVIAGIALLGTIDVDTPLVVVGSYMALVGIGLGATMQNLVLSVQNNVAVEDLGAASSVVAMFRSIGGSAGVAALGAVLAHQVTSGVTNGIEALVRAGKISQEQLAAMQHSTGDIPKLADLPAPIRSLYEASFGDAVGHLFLVAVPFAVVAFLCILFIKEVPLRTSTGPSVAESEVEAALVASGEPVDYPGYEVEGAAAKGERR
ncbi:MULTISPECIES: MDR family MFS transporter [unclassified Nocardioides]|uniref:MDR family MFS transporter n=1 Tax=unclassified Nocardioides TaxID=2615069 RepID=UPI00116AC0BC|nr:MULTISPECIES: MDR family MFS transporter [unclassified Nocardioides]TQK72945.1 EmrB/QacA subfamily drug resistance transporter [Nocardioides sp. SLBN-35]WGY02814.1 MDR family MFS transporter [Nocardioides sp. QY071]